MYAAGDCTGVLMLASVAAMQGRIAMWHFLGDAVAPLDLQHGSSNVFTAPEIATVGWSQSAVDAGEIDGGVGHAAAVGQPAREDAGRPRRLRQAVLPAGHRHRRRREWWSAPRASELIHPVAIAVAENADRRPARARVHGVPVDDRLGRRGGPPAAPLPRLSALR